MNVEIIQLRRTDDSGAVKAFVDIQFNHEITVKGFKVIDGKRGLFVSWPSIQGSDGRWYPSVTAADDQVKEDINRIVLEAYAET